MCASHSIPKYFLQLLKILPLTLLNFKIKFQLLDDYVSNTELIKMTEYLKEILTYVHH